MPSSSCSLRHHTLTISRSGPKSGDRRLVPRFTRILFLHATVGVRVSFAAGTKERPALGKHGGSAPPGGGTALIDKAEGVYTMRARSMDVARVFGFLVQGSSLNWWGLGCPAHCSGSLTLLCLAFGSGASVGFLLALVFFRGVLFSPVAQAAFTSESSVPSAPTVPRPASLRLRGYLHEPEIPH